MSDKTRNPITGTQLSSMAAKRGGGTALNAALLAQLRYRVEHGEDAAAILDEFGIKKPSRRKDYIDAIEARA